MSLRNTIINYFPELSDHERVDAHKEVIDSLSKLEELIPGKYSEYNLTHIIMPKAYGYHTLLDISFSQYIRIKKSINILSQNEYLSGLIAYKFLQMKRIDKAVKDHKDEIPIILSEKETNIESNLDGRSYNLFSANAQTYLRVMILYMNHSQYNNHLLVVPKYLKNVEILQMVKNAQLLFFEDYITEEIIQIYQKAKKDFHTFFNNNKNKLKEILFLDSRDFFKIIDTGLENVFKYLIPQALLFYLTYEEIYSKIKVKNVIGARVRKIYDRALYESASSHNINRYALLHSNIGVNWLNKMGHFNNLTGVFTWGNLQKKLIENDSFSNVKNIYVTGSPLFDKPHFNKNNIRKHNKCILYAATHNDLQELNDLVSIINSLPEIRRLIIKVHPERNHQIYEKYIKSEKIILVPGNRSLEDLLPKTDLLVTTISESALQSMVRNVPTIFFLLQRHWKQMVFPLYGFNQKENDLWVVNNKENLKNRIYKIFNSMDFRIKLIKQQHKFIKRRIRIHSKINGASKLIDEILKQGNQYRERGVKFHPTLD